MKIQLLRNATLTLSIAGKRILVDPMLAPKGSYPPVQNTANTLLNPLTDLAMTAEDLATLISQTDAVLLTHVHNDHWDPAARALLPKDMVLFCQPADVEKICEQGFTQVTGIEHKLTWEGIQIARTGGQHGTGDIGRRLGPVSGYAIRYEDENVYIAGDTIWCNEVKQAIDAYKPANIILNGGAARFVIGDPIIMDTNDIVAVCSYSPSSNIYITHMEAVNHYTESREATRKVIAAHSYQTRCFVPADGEVFIDQ